MLINKMTNNDDYVRSLKQRRWLFGGMLAVGVIGFICYFLLVPASALHDFGRGFYQGAASGLTVVSLFFLIRNEYLLRNPDARKKAKISEKDERQQQITNKASVAAGLITFFAAAAALFVVLPLNKGAFYALLGVTILYWLVFLAANIWLSKKI